MLKRLVAAACAALLACGLAYGQTGSQKSKTDLNAEINSLFPNNTVGAITPQQLRQVTLDLVASFTNLQNNAVSITDPTYGAKCDGATPDTTAINAALATGKTVIHPGGNCIIDGPLNFNTPGQAFIGAGQQVSTITASTSAVHILLCVNSTAVYNTIRNISIVGKAVDETSNQWGIMLNCDLQASMTADVLIEKVTLQALNISINGAAFVSNVSLRDSKIIGVIGLNDGYGYGFLCRGQNILVTGSQFIATPHQGRHAVYCSESDNVIYTNNHFEQWEANPVPGNRGNFGANGSWIVANNTFKNVDLGNTTVSNGNVTNIGPNANVITGLADTSNMHVNYAVVGTNIPAATRVMSVDSPTQITMDQNATGAGTVSVTVQLPTTRGAIDLEFQAPALLSGSDCAIANNVIINAGGPGLGLRGFSRCTITGNVIDGFAASYANTNSSISGITVSGSDNVIVTGNHMRNTTDAASNIPYILIADSNNVIVNGNLCDASGATSSRACVRLQGTTANANVWGNTARGTFVTECDCALGNSTYATGFGNNTIAISSLAISGAITPTALAGDVNDYNPTGLSSAFMVRINGGAADRNITGLVTANSGNGRLVQIVNVGTTNNLVLVEESGASSASNRFTLGGANLTLRPGMSVTLDADITSGRWRQLHGGATCAALPAFTGDISKVLGSCATTVAAIAGTAVSGTTGTTNVVFSAGTPNFTSSIRLSSQITPTVLAGDVNNYSPTGLSSATTINLGGGAADRNITGIDAMIIGVEGYLLHIVNVGATNNLVLKQSSGSSSNGNKFLFKTGDLTLIPNASVMLRYDAATSPGFWRPVSLN